MGNTFGEELKRLRTEAGLSQQDMADRVQKLGVKFSRSFLGMLEQGNSERLGADVLFRIAQVLDVNCSHFQSFLAPPPAMSAEEPPAKPKKQRKG